MSAVDRSPSQRTDIGTSSSAARTLLPAAHDAGRNGTPATECDGSRLASAHGRRHELLAGRAGDKAMLWPIDESEHILDPQPAILAVWQRVATAQRLHYET